MGLNNDEKNTLTSRYRFCDAHVERQDIVFAYPSSAFKGDVAKTADALQRIADHLKAATGVDPTTHFGRRCVVAYRHSADEGGKDCSPGWLPNWVNVPWGYLQHADQPLEGATHELAHPFVDLFVPAGDKAEWTEGLCDFLRIGGFAVVGNAAEARRREGQYIAASAATNGEHYHDNYHAPAGRLLKAMRAAGLDPDLAADIRQFLSATTKAGFITTYGPVP